MSEITPQNVFGAQFDEQRIADLVYAKLAASQSRKGRFAILGGYIAARLKEPSSWAGLGILAAAAGYQLTPDTLYHVVAIGTGAAGLLAVVLRDPGESSGDQR